jgi:prepilin-type N-terminal cleavage/methylation domain-containing protein
MRGEKGFTLIEVIIALALLGVVAVAILSGLSTGSRAIFVADERATAESLARSQMEYVKEQPYDATNNPPLYAVLPNIPENYQIDVTAVRLDPKGNGTGNDDGIQKITVTVGHHDKPEVITLEGYKVDR